MQPINHQPPTLQHPGVIFRPSLRRSSRHQRVVFGMDGSGSMAEGAKTKDSAAALLECCCELARPLNREAFEVAVIYFDDEARLVHPFMAASALITQLQPLEARSLDGNTNITSALELIRRMLEEAEAKSTVSSIRYLKPLAVLMSDGCHNTGPAPKSASQKLKQISDVLTVAFGDEDLLREIATEQCSVRCRIGADLRGYFAQIGRTLTITHAAGLSAATLLANNQT